MRKVSTVKIDVYLLPEQKEEIQRRADKLALSLSDYLKLKGLDKLKEDKDG